MARLWPLNRPWSTAAGDTHYQTGKGTKIPVDGTRAFWCLGRESPNTHFLKKNFGSSALDSIGYIKVDNKCRVQGVPRGNIFASGDCVFASAHPGGDRGYFGFNMHSFVARENIVALHEQLMAGKTPELCDCPQEMPFKIDPNCETGTGAVWVEPVKMLSLGHETFYLQLTPLPKSCKNAAVTKDVAKSVRGPLSLSLSPFLACLTSRISAAPTDTRGQGWHDVLAVEKGRRGAPKDRA